MAFWGVTLVMFGVSRLVIRYSSSDAQEIGFGDVSKLGILVTAVILFFAALPFGLATMLQSPLLGLSIFVGCPPVCLWMAAGALRPAAVPIPSQTATDPQPADEFLDGRIVISEALPVPAGEENVMAAPTMVMPSGRTPLAR